MITLEEVNELEDKLWKEFCKTYPLITSRNRFKRIIVALFMKQTSDELSFKNGFIKGFLEAQKLYLEEVKKHTALVQ
jgi:lactam utilization protein B